MSAAEGTAWDQEENRECAGKFVSHTMNSIGTFTLFNVFPHSPVEPERP